MHGLQHVQGIGQVLSAWMLRVLGRTKAWYSKTMLAPSDILLPRICSRPCTTFLNTRRRCVATHIKKTALSSCPRAYLPPYLPPYLPITYLPPYLPTYLPLRTYLPFYLLRIYLLTYLFTNLFTTYVPSTCLLTYLPTAYLPTCLVNTNRGTHISGLTCKCEGVGPRYTLCQAYINGEPQRASLQSTLSVLR